MPTRAQIVTNARTLVGLGEYPPGSNQNKITNAYGLIGPWCAMTTWFVYRAFGLDLRDAFTKDWAWTPAGMEAAKAKGLWRKGIAGARAGDLVYFKLPDGAAGPVNHTGIVTGLIYDPDGAVTGCHTIEGNTSNECRERERTAYIVGYIDMSGYLTEDPKPGQLVPPFPGADAFVVGRRNVAVTAVDRQLIRLGYTKHHDGDGYQSGPLFTEYTRKNIQDFQLAQGWKGTAKGGDADGYPGPQTWRRLFTTATPQR